MVHTQVSLRHDLLDVSVAEAISQITTDTEDDHLRFEVSAVEQWRAVPSHPMQRIKPSGALCNTSLSSPSSIPEKT
jgi:hypothetical protein